MVRIRVVQVRLTRNQYARLIEKTEGYGFNSLSAYVRFKALEEDVNLYEKVCEIHRHLLGDPRRAR